MNLCIDISKNRLNSERTVRPVTVVNYVNGCCKNMAVKEGKFIQTSPPALPCPAMAACLPLLSSGAVWQSFY